MTLTSRATEIQSARDVGAQLVHALHARIAQHVDHLKLVVLRLEREHWRANEGRRVLGEHAVAAFLGGDTVLVDT